jgi:nicotinate-nucleotide pyrophosphorylase
MTAVALTIPVVVSGVDYISVGSLTKYIAAVDFSLRIVGPIA